MEELKTFTTELTIDAKDKDEAEKILDKMFSTLTRTELNNVFDDGLKDIAERHFVERIRYVENWNGGDGTGEYFLFEGKWSDEDDSHWGLDTAFKLLDLDYKGIHEKGVLLNYQALTKIRELMKMGIDFYFG